MGTAWTDLAHARLDLGDLDAAYRDPVVIHDAAESGEEPAVLGSGWRMPTRERRYVG